MFSTLLSLIPTSRIHPHDGMAVSAHIWAEAHAYHDARMRGLLGLAHGTGILHGLSVKASDPADKQIYIEPGVALDEAGNCIVVQRPVAYSLGSAHGDLRIVITFGERDPVAGVQSAPGTAGDNALRVVSDFVVEAVNASPSAPHIELARVHRSSAKANVADAAHPNQPVADEIDLRHRNMTGAHLRATPARVAVVNLGGAKASSSLHGMQALAQHVPMVVDGMNIKDARLGQYRALMLHGGTPDVEEMKTLFVSLRGGTSMFVDGGESGPIQQAFESMGVKLAAVGRGHALLRSPNLFPADTGGLLQGAHENGTRVVLSQQALADAWAGEAASRAAIRDATDLGVNIWRWLL